MPDPALLAVALHADARADHLEATAAELTDLLADATVALLHCRHAYEDTLHELWRERQLRLKTERRLRELLEMADDTDANTRD